MTEHDRRDLRKTILILSAIVVPCLIGGVAGIVIDEGGLEAAVFLIAAPLMFALIFHVGLYFGSGIESSRQTANDTKTESEQAASLRKG